MAGREEDFLQPEERAKLLQDLDGDTNISDDDDDSVPVPPPSRRKRAAAAAAAAPRPRSNEDGKKKPKQRQPKIVEIQDTGCLICTLDNDHANLLLCESCNGEYHTYCLSPPLSQIPKGDWFCDKCRPDEGDGMERLVAALPPSVTCRYGEICWAQGGVGYGWWPACIYDPRLTVGNARTESKKHLGRKYLVYFFQCDESPFAMLNTFKIASWEEGLAGDLHLGRAARNFSKQRHRIFKQAMEAAVWEHNRPVSQRLDAARNDEATGANQNLLPSPVKLAAAAEQKRRKKLAQESRRELMLETPRLRKERPHHSNKESRSRKRLQYDRAPSPSWSDSEEDALSEGVPREVRAPRDQSSTETVEDHGGDMYCRIFREQQVGEPINCGFIILPNRQTVTFEDIRDQVSEQLVPDTLPPSLKWQFHLPSLGPMLPKQERELGPVDSFMAKSMVAAGIVGEGTMLSPLELHLVEVT